MADVYASLVFEAGSPTSDKVYDYRIPDACADEVQVGKICRAPFGSRTQLGYVVAVHDALSPGLPTSKVKAILDVVPLPPLFGETEVTLARWISRHYFCFLILALKLFLPPDQKQLKDLGDESGKRVVRKKKTSNQPEMHARAPHLTLTPHQSKADAAVQAMLTLAGTSSERKPILLHGITGSGKTEIYLRAIEQVIAQGKQAVVVFPEIVLTTHMVSRFAERFGERLGVWHSGIPERARQETWQRIRAGKIDVVVGARSVLFCGFPRLGLIVLDEEYDGAYKQENHPRYHVRTVAAKLAALTQSVLLMGSATPSLESYYAAERGEYQLVTLPERVDSRPLPPVEIVDLRGRVKKGGGKWVSDRLRQVLSEVLTRGEQAILFFNRRGFSTFLVCRDCGCGVQCPRCSVSLTYHREGRFLACHHCNFRQQTPVSCPNCQSGEIGFLGAGTQKLEGEVKQLFPQARVVRLDRDVAARRGQVAATLQAFDQGEADILLGTRMVTKGLDFHRVTLVGVMEADSGLSFPDFRSAEQTFQVVAQVAGRAGRHALPGRVVVQTFTPDHYSIQAAAHHDYETFYRQEVQFRRTLTYPPFCELINVLAAGRERGTVVSAMEQLTQRLLRQAGEALTKLGGQNGHTLPSFDILGPALSPIEKRRSQFRAQALIKTNDVGFASDVLRAVLSSWRAPRVQFTVDVDPHSFM